MSASYSEKLPLTEPTSLSLAALNTCLPKTWVQCCLVSLAPMAQRHEIELVQPLGEKKELRSGPSPWIQDPLLVRHKSPPKKNDFKHSSGLSNHPPSIMIPCHQPSSSTIINHHLFENWLLKFPLEHLPQPPGSPRHGRNRQWRRHGRHGRHGRHQRPDGRCGGPAHGVPGTGASPS